MKVSILDKISRELSNGIDTEPKTLYLLAEIRKFIDGYCQKEKTYYPNLYFYCDWVLHIEMDRTPTKIILDRFESIFLGINNLDKISKIFKKQEKDFYQLEGLKKELKSFFKIYSLSTELIDNKRMWYHFEKLLVEILIDCSLANKKGMVSRFSYEKGEDDQIRFRVKMKNLGSFKITLKEK